MIQETGFFRLLWRFIALALAGFLVLGGLVAAYALYEIVGGITDQRRVSELVDPDPGADAATVERLGPLSPLGRSGLLWAPVERTTDKELRYASKRATAVVDYLIYDPRTGAVRQLLDQRPALILEARVLIATREDGRRRGPDLALFIRYVAADGDGDDRLTAEDPERLALARPDGTELTTLADGVKSLSLVVLSPEEAVATIRESNAGETALHLDLKRLAVGRRTTLWPAP